MTNDFEILEDIVYLSVPTRNGKIIKSILDLIDLEVAQSIKGIWRAIYSENAQTYYVQASQGIGLHRLITKCPKELEIDHLNKNALDNRRKNLEIVTQKLNLLRRKRWSHNSSGTTGVCFDKAMGRWKAYMKLEKRAFHLGYFFDKNKAIAARISAEERYINPLIEEEYAKIKIIMDNLKES